MQELPIIECRLDLAGLREQRDRYAAIGSSVARIERSPQRLVVELGEEVDGRLVEETVAVERECCPFFALDYDADARRLVVTVEDPAHDAALDAIEHALGVPSSA